MQYKTSSRNTKSRRFEHFSSSLEVLSNVRQAGNILFYKICSSYPFCDVFDPFLTGYFFLIQKVDIILSRDLDSRFSARELAAVVEWRKTSNHSIHSMRDHPSHHAPLLAAAWGTDLTRYITDASGNKMTARQAWKTSWNQMLQDKEINADRHQYFPDQILIAR